MADAARARKIADRIKEVVAANLGSLVKDPDLGFVTITDVKVTGDLQHATIYYTVYGDQNRQIEAGRGLASAKGNIRSQVGRQLGLRLTPTIEFVADALPESARTFEDALTAARFRDEQIAKSAEGAEWAGDSDPYRKPEEDVSDDDESAPNSAAADTSI